MNGLFSGAAARAALRSAYACLAELHETVGHSGLAVADEHPSLMAAVDQHGAAIRETLRAAGRDVDVVSLAGYARSVLALLNRGGHTLPEPDAIDWARAGTHVLRLVATCALAEAADLL